MTYPRAIAVAAIWGAVAVCALSGMIGGIWLVMIGFIALVATIVICDD